MDEWNLSRWKARPESRENSPTMVGCLRLGKALSWSSGLVLNPSLV